MLLDTVACHGKATPKASAFSLADCLVACDHYCAQDQVPKTVGVPTLGRQFGADTHFSGHSFRDCHLVI
jgi:hypothetical protein